MTALGFLIMIASSAVSLVLTVIGTPLAQIKSTANDACITMWGLKNTCNDNTYTTRTADLETTYCAAWTSRMKAAEAFAIISIVAEAVTLVLTIVGFLQKQNVMRWVSGALGVFCVTSLVITWGAVAADYQMDVCNRGWSIKDGGNVQLGAGFGLIVTSFCVMVVASVLVLVLPSGFDDVSASA